LNIPKGRTSDEQIQIYIQQGYSKLWKNGKAIALEKGHEPENLEIIVDRITNDNRPENQSRILESLELGFHEGKGKCNIISFNGKKTNN
jgi:excinuclease ABC subunit A